MEAAKAAARSFIEGQPESIQIGVVAFSGSGISVQVPTNDQAAILASINRLGPTNGTSLGNGILAALNTIISIGASQKPTLHNLGRCPPSHQHDAARCIHLRGDCYADRWRKYGTSESL
jgi:hypothetical protein